MKSAYDWAVVAFMAWFVVSITACEGEIDKFFALVAMPFLLAGVTALACLSVAPLFLVPIGLAFAAVGLSKGDFVGALQGLGMSLAGAFSVWVVFGS